MSLFAPARETRLASDRIPTNGELGPRSAAAREARVTPQSALRHATVNACVSLIANMATWPVHGYRDRDGRKIREATDPIILRRPSAEATPIEWRRELLVGWLTEGTQFGIVAQRQSTIPTQIELLPGECVQVRPADQRALGGWEFLVDGKVETLAEHGGRLWRSKGLWTRPGWPVGLSPVEMACEAIGLGIVAEQFASRWFVDGATPTGILTHPDSLTEDQAKSFKARFVSVMRGKREPAVLSGGVTYQQVQVPANESQFLETLEANKATVANFFLVPPELVGGSTASMTYSNVESRSLHLLQQAYHPWLSKFEETLNGVTPRPVYVKLSDGVLLRLDQKTSAELMDMELRNGTLGWDEARAKLDRPPAAETGDTFVWPPAGVGKPAGDPEKRAIRVNVDATTTVADGAIRIDSPVDARTTVDAPTSITDGAIRIDAPVDARTDVQAPTTISDGAVRVDSPVDARTTVGAAAAPEVTVTVPEREVHIDARTTVEAAKPSSKVIHRNQSGDIERIEER